MHDAADLKQVHGVFHSPTLSHVHTHPCQLTLQKVMHIAFSGQEGYDPHQTQEIGNATTSAKTSGPKNIHAYYRSHINSHSRSESSSRCTDLQVCAKQLIWLLVSYINTNRGAATLALPSRKTRLIRRSVMKRWRQGMVTQLKKQDCTTLLEGATLDYETDLDTITTRADIKVLCPWWC